MDCLIKAERSWKEEEKRKELEFWEKWNCECYGWKGKEGIGIKWFIFGC